jgi:FtsZ-binding cell division protein ZapB
MTEKHELCHPAALICQNEEVAQMMTDELAEKNEAIDLEEAEAQASEDVVAAREAALAKQLAEMRRRKRKLVDPLQYEMSIADEDLINYVPSFGYEMMPASSNQLSTLEKFGILPESVDNAGKADMLIDKLIKRRQEGYTTPKQIRFLEGKGFRRVGEWQFDDARSLIDRIAGNGWRIPVDIAPSTYRPHSERQEDTVWNY